MNSILKLTDENNCLRQKSEEIKENEKNEALELLKNNLEEEENAAGLALPQLGINRRAIGIRFVEEDDDTENAEIIILFNPKISQKSKKTFIQKENCLSIPNKNGDVERFVSVSVKHDHGIMNFRNFYSAVVQHEIDHLDGILFIDRAENIREEE
jgi:peptide deformylase